MRVAIIGAGAMGSFYGCYLSCRHDILMVDSYEPQVRAINEQGVCITEPDGTQKTYRLKAILSGTPAEPADLVIVLVKAFATADAIRENNSLIGPKTYVLTLQNGAGNDRAIAGFVDRERVAIGTTRHNCVTQGLGKIVHSGCGPTVVGPMLAGSNADHVVAGMLEGCGFEVSVADDIQRIIWSKLFINMSVNTLSALLGCRLGFIAEDPYAWDFAKRIVYEGVMIAEADGTYFDRREALETVRKTCLANPNGYASMCQDRMHKRRTEIDAINGAVVEQAKIYGYPVTYNALVVDLIHAIEGTYAEKPFNA